MFKRTVCCEKWERSVALFPWSQGAPDCLHDRMLRRHKSGTANMAYLCSQHLDFNGKPKNAAMYTLSTCRGAINTMMWGKFVTCLTRKLSPKHTISLYYIKRESLTPVRPWPTFCHFRRRGIKTLPTALYLLLDLLKACTARPSLTLHWSAITRRVKRPCLQSHFCVSRAFYGCLEMRLVGPV